MMNDLISRQAAIEAIEAVFPVDPMKSVHAQGIALGAALAKTYVEQLPSAQPERCEDCGNFNKTRLLIPQPEIIRCKDCKWYKTNYSWNGKEHKVCVIEPYEPIRKGDDFCSRAERRTDE